MNAEDRKILGEHGKHLATLLERTQNTYHIVEKMEQHQAFQNGAIAQNDKDIAVLKDRGPGIRTKVGGGIGAAGIIAWNIIMWFRQQNGG